MSEKKQEDPLKQLEKLLNDDLKNTGSGEKGDSIPRRELSGIIIRLSASLILILLLYFTGIFDRPIFVSFAVLFIVGIEIFRYFKARQYRANHFDR